MSEKTSLIREKTSAGMRAYWASPKGQARKKSHGKIFKRWQASKEGRDYWASPKGRARIEALREGSKRYWASPEGQARKKSPEYRAQLKPYQGNGAENPFYGHTHTSKHRVKMAEGLRRAMKDPERRSKFPQLKTGWQPSPEQRAKVGAAVRRCWQDPVKREELREKMRIAQLRRYERERLAA
jgi:hypothetical protein